MEIRYHDVHVESALRKVRRKLPYQWELDVYRGCQHGCRYCHAVHTHKGFEAHNFYQDIHVKSNIVDLLEEELKKDTWARETINFGGITDCYQPAEAHYKLMPEILKLLIKYKTPAMIATKSIIPLRDFDLLEELANVASVNLAASITTTDEELRIGLEPYCASTEARFKMLKAFAKTKVSTGVHVMPIIPYLTDTRVNQEKLLSMAKEAGVDYVLPAAMYLMGETRPCFMDFVKAYDLEAYENLLKLYRRGSAGKPYKTKLYHQFNEIREAYGLSDNFSNLFI